MFAARRTARVNGRMILLTSSIMTIRGPKLPGAPVGTRWAALAQGLQYKAANICPSHKGREIANVIAGCLEGVKTKGNKPHVLKIIIRQKILKYTKIWPLDAQGEKSDFISFNRNLINICSKLRERDEAVQKVTGIKVKTARTLNHPLGRK